MLLQISRKKGDCRLFCFPSSALKKEKVEILYVKFIGYIWCHLWGMITYRNCCRIGSVQTFSYCWFYNCNFPQHIFISLCPVYLHWVQLKLMNSSKDYDLTFSHYSHFSRIPRTCEWLYSVWCLKVSNTRIQKLIVNLICLGYPRED